MELRQRIKISVFNSDSVNTISHTTRFYHRRAGGGVTPKGLRDGAQLRSFFTEDEGKEAS